MQDLAFFPRLVIGIFPGANWDAIKEVISRNLPFMPFFNQTWRGVNIPEFFISGLGKQVIFAHIAFFCELTYCTSLCYHVENMWQHLICTVYTKAIQWYNNSPSLLNVKMAAAATVLQSDKKSDPIPPPLSFLGGDTGHLRTGHIRHWMDITRAKHGNGLIVKSPLDKGTSCCNWI